jgi:endonuclease/exonuclease/phosphatase family metal-dependent hydrolase
MPCYNDLRPEADFKERDYELVFPQMQKIEKKRTLSKLLELKRGLDASIAGRRNDHNLIIASWNIKEFGHTTQRLPESYFYIAEILSCFDLVAIQEIKSTLDDLHILLRLLGKDWGYLVNDITEGDAGNSERSCYIFNKKRVQLAGLAGEIVLWDDLTRHSNIKQLKRTPYITGFTAGWKTFALINIHLHPGDGADDFRFRHEEVTLLLRALAEKRGNGRLWTENLIIVGDCNLYNGSTQDDPTIEMIQNAGYREVESLVGVHTNTSETEAYDRLFLTRSEYFSLGQSSEGRENGGVFNPFDYVFKPGEETVYRDYMKAHYTGSRDMDNPANQKGYFNHPWRKNQMSDHFPIWCELITDSSPVFLERNLQSHSDN